LDQGRLGHAMPRLNDAGLAGARGGTHARRTAKELADADGIRGVVGALVDHLQDVVGANDAGGDLHASGAPALPQRHLATAERHLITGDGDGVEDRAADHPLRVLIQEREVVAAHGVVVAGATPASARSVRSSTSSDWKST